MTKSQNRKQRAEKQRDYIPVTVPLAATLTGETLGIAQWAHYVVWTDRMLATLLEDKVRGGKWHTLIDKVFSELNLYCSAHKVLGKNNTTQIGRIAGGYYPADQPGDAGLVQLFSPLPMKHLSGIRRHDTPPPETSASETQPAKLTTPSSHAALAERLLYGVWIR